MTKQSALPAWVHFGVFSLLFAAITLLILWLGRGYWWQGAAMLCLGAFILSAALAVVDYTWRERGK